MVDRRTGRLVSELRLTESCPNGKALCSLTTSASRPDGHQAYDPYSDVIFLNGSFVIPLDFTAAYAMVMPGFATYPWPFTMRDVRFGHPKTDRSMIAPKLGDDIVWLRVSCGPG